MGFPPPPCPPHLPRVQTSRLLTLPEKRGPEGLVRLQQFAEQEVAGLGVKLTNSALLPREPDSFLGPRCCVTSGKGLYFSEPHVPSPEEGPHQACPGDDNLELTLNLTSNPALRL